MLEDKALKTIRSSEMMKGVSSLVIGVSGGADSVALLDLIKRSFPGVGLHVCHVNHMLRGKESDRDQAFAKALSARYRASFHLLRTDIKKTARKLKISEEEAGRQARYAFFESVASSVGAQKIAVAHTADDNVETFIMRLLRGAGLKGLSSIPGTRGQIIRPFLDVSKKEVLDYCRKRRLKYVEDSSNKDDKYLRNAVRNRFLPLMKEFNPNIYSTVTSLVKNLAVYQDMLDEVSRKAFDEVLRNVTGKEVRFDLDEFRSLHPAVRDVVVIKAIEKIKKDARDISWKLVRSVSNLSKGTVSVPGGIWAYKDNGQLVVSLKAPEKGKAARYRRSLTVPGTVLLSVPKVKMTAGIVAELPPKKAIGRDEAYIDAQICGQHLVVRNFEKGDKMRPLGMKGTKKVSDIFIDEKVPADDRVKFPVVTDLKGAIIWLPGIRLDRRFMVTQNTRKIVRLSLEELKNIRII